MHRWTILVGCVPFFWNCKEGPDRSSGAIPKMRYAPILVCCLIPFIALIHSHPVIATTQFRSASLGRQFPPSPLTVPSDAVSLPGDKEGQQPAHATTALATLVQQSTLIVRGEVSTIQSFWDRDHRLLESAVTVRVAYPLLGKVGDTVTLHTPGGYLAEEGLGMVSLHAATFTTGEDVLLFLRQQGTQWQMVDGAAGKFHVQGQALVNTDWALAAPLVDLLATITTLSTTRNERTPLAALWVRDNPTVQWSALPTTAASQRPRRWPMPHAAATYYVNINSNQATNTGTGDKTGQGPTAGALRDAIIAAADQWSHVNSADFALRYGGATQATTTGYNGVNEILFMAKGRNARAAAAEVWYTADLTIVEADIWINDDFRWDTSGAPPSDKVDLQSAVLHEFGHWLILGHCTETQSIMYPQLTSGHVKRTLHSEDIAGISAIYPR